MRGYFLYIDPKKLKFGSKLDENAEIDSAKFWNFGFWKIWIREKSKIAPSKPEIELRFWILGIEIQNPSQKLKNLQLKTWNSITILIFRAQNLISKISKSISLVPLEFRFETPKFEIANIENPQILIFASKFKFFFDQNLDFVLG